MALTYEIESRLQALQPVIEELIEWHDRVVRRMFYVEEYGDNDLLDLPESFTRWADDPANSEVIGGVIIEQLRKTFIELRDLGIATVRLAAQSVEKPSVRAYDQLATIHEQFIGQLSRLQYDLAMADSGMDSMTGLRHAKALWQDMAREMERLARRGRPFCLALVQIESHDVIKASQNEENYKKILAVVTKQIKKCIRSFDDAYYMGNGEFIMCLKQSEQAGGSAAISRLLRFMDEEDPKYMKDGQPAAVSLDCCVAEPMPGDDIKELLDNMRADLGRYDIDNAPALEYIEKSPLQRMIEEMED